ncbi:MAG: hypothetical protein U5R31_02115 [Acidimicrobiia bacterium]|nr:hypothetical protein [Acidimicrobiia bacterium]
MRIGLALGGRRVEQRQVADAGEAHLQGARDGCGRERQRVDVGAELFDGLLVGHPEALLLVDDEQPELVEPDVIREQAVGADDDVDLAGTRTRSITSRACALVRKRLSTSTRIG